MAETIWCCADYWSTQEFQAVADVVDANHEQLMEASSCGAFIRLLIKLLFYHPKVCHTSAGDEAQLSLLIVCNCIASLELAEVAATIPARQATRLPAHLSCLLYT